MIVFFNFLLNKKIEKNIFIKTNLTRLINIINMVKFILIILFITCISASETNIYTETTSILWSDPNNWSLGHVPYVYDNVILSPGSVVVLFDPNVCVAVRQLNVTSGCVLNLFSNLTIKNTTLISGSVIVFDMFNTSKIEFNNGLIWLSNNANVVVEHPAILHANDIIIAGPCSTQNNCRLLFNGQILNHGNIIILENTTLYVDDYTQSHLGLLYLHYNITANNIGTLNGMIIFVFGEILLISPNCNYHKISCVPIISADGYVIVTNLPIDICHHLTYFNTNGTTSIACF